MGKIKSAICLILATLIIAALSFICFVPISGGGVTQFDPVVTWIGKDANLGVEFGANDAYYGGGYSALYYPEGVISDREYQDDLAGMQEGTEKEEYAEKYVQVGGLRFDSEKITVENGKVSDAQFEARFAYAKDKLVSRYKSMNIPDLRIEVVDGYALRVFVPQAEDTLNAYTSLFSIFGYMGGLEVLYGADADSATTALPARPTESIGQYVAGASSAADATGAHYVVVTFTDEGKDRLASKTAEVSESSTGVLVFKIGEETVISLTIESAVSENRIYVSNPNSPFTAEAAQALATLIDSEAKSTVTIPDGVASLNYDSAIVTRGLYGENALMYLYIAFGICFAGMMVFFFVRYGLLGFVHLYTYMLFLLVTILCMWALPFIQLSAGTFAAVLLASLLLSVSQAVVYENARKEYKTTGKTLAACIKNAYKNCFWHIFDVHIVVAALSFITYGIALAPLSAFAFMLGLGTLFSGIGALALGRFLWAVMMSFTNKKARFCNFKREEVEDND